MTIMMQVTAPYVTATQQRSYCIIVHYLLLSRHSIYCGVCHKLLNRDASDYQCTYRSWPLCLVHSCKCSFEIILELYWRLAKSGPLHRQLGVLHVLVGGYSVKSKHGRKPSSDLVHRSRRNILDAVTKRRRVSVCMTSH